MLISEVVNKYQGVAIALTSHAWKSWCRQFVERWGERHIESLDAGDINLFIVERRKQGKAEATIRSQLMTLHRLYSVARQAGVKAYWPEGVARMKVKNDRVRTFKGNEHQRLQAVMHPSDFRIAELARATGLRSSELWNVTRDDVDLKTRFIHVREAKGGKSRRVPIGKTAFRILKNMLTTQRTVYLVVPLGHEKYANRKTSLHTWKRDVWRPALRAAGIEDLHFHDMRHEFASTMARAGKSLQVIKECLGHESMAMTLRYAHLNDATLHDAVSCV